MRIYFKILLYNESTDLTGRCMHFSKELHVLVHTAVIAFVTVHYKRGVITTSVTSLSYPVMPYMFESLPHVCH